MSMCIKCGQYGQADGGIGCICGKTECPGCKHYECIRDGETYCYLCRGEIERQEKGRCEAAVILAARAWVVTPSEDTAAALRVAVAALGPHLERERRTREAVGQLLKIRERA